MKRLHYKPIAVVLGALALILPLTQSWAADAAPAAKPTLTLQQLHAQQLPLLQQALENAQKAVEMGQKDNALMELKKAQTLLTLVQQTLAQNIKPAFVNTICPIMGSKIDPAKVTDALTRDFHGQKVAFCCPMCPPKWDKLSDAEKQAKLTKAINSGSKSMPMQMHMDMDHDAD